jgi:hypothetical protein
MTVPAITIRTAAGVELPPILSTRDTAEILGWDEDTVLAHCHKGLIETMPRIGRAPWQIITAKLLRQLGLIPEISEL